MGYQARGGEQPAEPGHAEDEAGQVARSRVPADNEVPSVEDADEPPDIVTEADSAGMAGGSSGSSSGGSGTPGHPDAAR
ncbi:MAG TPA: preprotein translocase YidC [Micromonosporaceae bacterium]